MPQLEGRAFSRMQQYEALPVEFQNEIKALEYHLISFQTQVFEKHHPKLLKTARGVKYKDLLVTIDEYLGGQTRATPPSGAGQHPMGDHQSMGTHHHPVGHHSPTTGHTAGHHHGNHHTAHAPTAQAPMDGSMTAAGMPTSHGHVLDGSPSNGVAHSPTLTEKMKLKFKGHTAIDPARLAHAKKLVEGLVLRGFLTPYKEDDTLTHMHMREDYVFKDSDLLVPVSSVVAGLPEKSTSVWDLMDGALFAGVLHRKTGLMEKLKHGKTVYAIVNARNKTLSLFDTDVSRVPLLQVDVIVEGTHASMDISHFDHGIKITTDTATEQLGFSSANQLEEFTIALRAVGTRFQNSVPDLHNGVSPQQQPLHGVHQQHQHHQPQVGGPAHHRP